MSFLDRFHHKISTVTAQGHLKKADGSEEIRVGPPKRKPNAPTAIQRHVPGQQRSQQPAHASIAATTAHRVLANNNHTTAVNNQPPAFAKQQLLPAQQPQHATKASPSKSPKKKTDNNNTTESYDLQRRIVRDDEYTRPEYDYQQPAANGRKSPTSKSSPQPSPSPTKQPPQKSPFRSPQEVNEARVQTEQDRLAFSRKARPVQYEPCKLSQYKKEKPTAYYELGKLQPDLNAEELVQKRANMERIKAFSKSLREINKKIPTNNNHHDPTFLEHKPHKPSAREKALAFARHIPKPRRPQVLDPSSHSPVAYEAPASNAIYSHARAASRVLEDDDLEDDDELQQLQLRHQASKAQVDAFLRK